MNAAAVEPAAGRFVAVFDVVVVTGDFEVGPVVGTLAAPDVVVTLDLGAVVVVVAAAPGFGP